jgi:hypothetical protein
MYMLYKTTRGNTSNSYKDRDLKHVLQFGLLAAEHYTYLAGLALCIWPSQEVAAVGRDPQT